MRPSTRRLLLLASLAATAHALPVSAQAPAALAAASGPMRSARDGIAAQRAAIEQRYLDQERECAGRFVVTACRNDARQQRRNALAPLRQEELRIEMVERQHRAATRLEEIEAKQRADAARDAASSPGATASVRGLSKASEPVRAPLVAPRRSAPIDAAERRRREVEAEAEFNARQARAEQHRVEVERRNAERAAKGKAVRPLPVASSASTAS